jgi:BlaR1 peptidase M56/uncharacterized protein DUF3471
MLALLPEAALRSLALGAAAWLMLKLLRVRNPHAQMTVWTVVLIASLTMPALMRRVTVTLPAGTPASRLTNILWASPSLPSEALPSRLEPTRALRSPAPSLAAVPLPVEATPAPPSRPPSLERDRIDPPQHATSVPVARWAFDWLTIATGIYVLVTAVLLLRLLTGILLTWRLARAARPIGHSWAAGMDVRVSDLVVAPVTFGLTILLPPECAEWSLAKRQAVLTHERSHVARGDFYVLLLAAFNRAVFWFNPFAWWLLRRLAELAEIISDDAAIEALDDRPSYADILLDVARHVQRAPAALAMARPATVRQRVERILDATHVPATMSWRRRLLVTTALSPLVAMSAASIALGTSGAVSKPIVIAQAASEPLVVAQATSPPEHQGVAAETKLLDDYVGFYAADAAVRPDLVFAVTREGDHLFVQSTGQARLEVFPESDRAFFYGVVDAEITFPRAGEGRAAAMVLHQSGMDIEATRVDAAAAKRAAELFDRRFADQAKPRTAVDVDPKALDAHVGYYRLTPRSIFAVTREGDQLFAQLTGQQKFQLFPESTNEYFYKAVAAQITFASDGSGRTTALILHQNGRDFPSMRVDQAAAEAADAKSRDEARQRADQERSRAQIALDPNLLDRYAGLYQRGPSSIFTITREGDQLFAQLTGQPKFAIFPESDGEFFYRAVAAQITFVTDSLGRPSELILHQNGRDLRAARLADVPPNDHQDVKVDAKILDSHVGWYEFNQTRALAVTREDGRLFVQETRRPRFEVIAASAEDYVSEDGKTFVIFRPDDQGRATELLLQDPSQGARRAVRVDEARAKTIEEAFVRQIAVAPDRFKDQTPVEGGKAAVLRAIEDLQRGTPNYDRMSPPLAEAVRQQLPQLHARLTALGSVESIFFRGVNPGGYDIYGVKFTGGSAGFWIRLAPDAKSEDIIFRPGGDDTPGNVLDCALEQTLKPLTGTAPTRLVFFNASGADIRVFELDFEGKRRPYSTIGDERFGEVWTYVSRPFVIADTSGQCREIVLPGQRTRYVALWPFQSGAPPQPGAPRMTPATGSDEVLRQHIEGLRRGEPNYDQMTPLVAAETRQELLLEQAILAKLGSIRGMSFRGVTNFGSDIYTVQFANGSAEWRIGLANGGRIRQIALGPQY